MMTDSDEKPIDEKPVGQSTLGAFFDQANQTQLPGKTQEMVVPRNPQGSAGEFLSDLCQWCLNPFDYKVSVSGWHRTSVEYDALRRALHIAEDCRPVICQSCYNMVTGTANNATLGLDTPGWSSSPWQANSSPNLVIAQQP